MKFKLPLFIIVMTLLTSCGTFRKSKKAILVDTDPRGVDVYNDQWKKVGETPYIFVPESSEQIIKVEGKQLKASDFCKIDWNGSVIPSLVFAPFFPVGTVVSAAILTNEYITDNVFKCLGRKKLELNRIKNKNPNYQDNYLIFPAPIKDELMSDKIIDLYQNILKQKGKRFIKGQKYLEELEVMGIDHIHNSDPVKIKKEFILEIAQKYNVQKIIYFEVLNIKNHVEIKPKIYDIPKDALLTEELPPKSIEYTYSLKNKIIDNLIDVINILPNSIIASYKTNPDTSFSSALYPNEPNKEVPSSRHPEAFPRALTIFGLNTINHPNYYRPWDFGLTFNPSFGISSWTNSLNNSSYIVNTVAYYALYNATLSGYSPLGILSFDVGLGLGLFDMNDNDGLDSKVTTMILKFGFDYSFFFNDRFFLSLKANNYSPTKKDLGNSNTLALDSWSETSFGIGYYFPSLKGLVRSLLPN